MTASSPKSARLVEYQHDPEGIVDLSEYPVEWSVDALSALILSADLTPAAGSTWTSQTVWTGDSGTSTELEVYDPSVDAFLRDWFETASVTA